MSLRTHSFHLMKPSTSAPPFAIFFPLAALDAFIVGGGWICALRESPVSRAIADIAAWHRRELLFGYVVAVLAGFLLTALPRWTGLALPKGAVPTVLCAWIAARFAPTYPSPLAPLALAPAMGLVLIAPFHIWRARDWRNAKTALLLALFTLAGSASLSGFALPWREFAMKVAISAMVSLIMVVGGRVLPALTARFDELGGVPAVTRRRRALEPVSAVLAFAGLGFWLFTPEGAPSAILLLGAGAGQAGRMASWFRRRAFASPSLIALYAAYASIPVGFGLLALHALAPNAAPASAGLHVWTIGGFGGMSLAIKASMIRKRCDLAFTPSRAAETAVALCLGAAAARVSAAFSAEPSIFLYVSAMAWSAGFALFLFAFRAPVVEAAFRRPREARRRNPRTEIRR